MKFKVFRNLWRECLFLIVIFLCDINIENVFVFDNLVVIVFLVRCYSIYLRVEFNRVFIEFFLR